MNELDVLYRDTLLEYADRVSTRALTNPSRRTTLYNSACGDVVDITVQMSGEKMVNVCVVASGCVICKASGCLLEELSSGKSRSSLRAKINDARRVLGGRGVLRDNSNLNILSGVSQFPSRVKCALLPWEALEKVVYEKG